MKRLVITNGKSGVDAIVRAGIEGMVISWDDVLHDGAVPWDLDFEALAERRIAELVLFEWGTEREVRRKFEFRNRSLQLASQMDEIVCWFEHDLYDQLQLWQLLDWLTPHAEKVKVLCEANYITSHSLTDLQGLFENRKTILATDLEEASQLWAGFRSPVPDVLWAMLGSCKLRFADATINRWAQCFPSLQRGLNKVERTTLHLLSLETTQVPFFQLFTGVSQLEDPQFMGDASFFLVLKRLASLNEPLVSFHAAPKRPYPEVSITPEGINRVHLDSWRWDELYTYWVGGVQLSNSNQWLFDETEGRFVFRSTTS